MGLRNQLLFDRGKVCSIYEETLSDGSKVYSVRVYDSGNPCNYVEIEALDEKHATRIFQVIEVKE